MTRSAGRVFLCATIPELPNSELQFRAPIPSSNSECPILQAFFRPAHPRASLEAWQSHTSTKRERVVPSQNQQTSLQLNPTNSPQIPYKHVAQASGSTLAHPGQWTKRRRPKPLPYFSRWNLSQLSRPAEVSKSRSIGLR